MDTQLKRKQNNFIMPNYSKRSDSDIVVLSCGGSFLSVPHKVRGIKPKIRSYKRFWLVYDCFHHPPGDGEREGAIKRKAPRGESFLSATLVGEDVLLDRRGGK